MKLRWLCWIPVFIVILVSAHSVYGEALQPGLIIGDDVNVRSGPALESDVICRIQQGALVNVIEQGSGWVKVQLADEHTGWVKQQFIKEKASQTPQNQVTQSFTVDEVLNFANSLMGISYVYGGASLQGFDCSGFTMYVLAKFGIQLPHEASQQMMMGSVVAAKEDLLPGDLVFFKTLGSKVVNHVGIYLGNNLFIHAASGFGAIRVSELSDSYYANCYEGGRRLFTIPAENSPG